METTGLERVPAHTACIFMSNHVSNLDPPALIPRIPGRTSAFLKRSLMKIPLLGYGMKLGDFVPVDRDGRVESAMESVAVARRVLEKGIHITTFVEGTRSRDGRMLPFKKGPFYLAMEAGAPCVPVSIHGTESMMSKGSSRVRPGTAHITFHEPLDPRQVRQPRRTDGSGAGGDCVRVCRSGCEVQRSSRDKVTSEFRAGRWRCSRR